MNEAALLVRNTFKALNYDEGSMKAVQDYMNQYDPTMNEENLRKRFKLTPICFVATNKSKIIGMIRGFEYRLINLFVDRRYHRKGIGSELLSRFEKECVKKGSKEIKIRSSIYAVPFNEANGYKKTTGIRNLDGLKIQPMNKRFQG